MKASGIKKKYGVRGTFAKRFKAEVQKAYKKAEAEFKKQKNPSELLKSGEWTPAHAVRIRKGKLEILR